MNPNGTDVVAIEAGQSVRALTTQDLLHRVERIREVQLKVMKEGVDYGTIQGCGDKPTLLKPGAETLLLAFEMSALPDQMSIQDLGDTDEVRYRVITPIVHVPTNRLFGNGVGECSSLEEKYKWRKAVCEAEWDNTDPDRRRLKYYKEGGTVQQVRTNKADVANTVLKMAKKRSLVDGALTVTAASRVFTQDVEDMPEELRDGQPKQSQRAAPSHEPHLPNYGKYAGQPFSAVPTDGDGGLRDYLSGIERSVDDPKRAKFKAANEKLRDALKAEIAKREGATAAAPVASAPGSPPVSGAPSFPEEKWQEFLSYLDDSPDRRELKELVKKEWKLKSLKDLHQAERPDFIREMQDAAKANGLTFERFVP